MAPEDQPVEHGEAARTRPTRILEATRPPFSQDSTSDSPSRSRAQRNVRGTRSPSVRHDHRRELQGWSSPARLSNGQNNHERLTADFGASSIPLQPDQLRGLGCGRRLR